MNSGTSEASVMDPASNDAEPQQIGSFGWTSSAGSSFRRSFFGVSRIPSFRANDDIEIETGSLDGDIGDRTVHSSRLSSGSNRFSFECAMGNSTVVPVQDEETQSAVSPLPEEITSPLTTVVQEKSQDKEILNSFWDNTSYLLHLAVFGILGVITRDLLHRLFGPSGAGVTGPQNYIHLDTPSNMLGSFLMGWFGVVFKGKISRISDHLAVGLSTGYLGSLTTFSAWNQDMLDLIAQGRWLFAAIGFLLGMFLAAYSIIFGIHTANGFRWLLLLQRKTANKDQGAASKTKSKWRVNTYKRHFVVIALLIAFLAVLWITSGVLLMKEFTRNPNLAQLCLACSLAPLGVWIRWLLARLNGRGLGKAGLYTWFPFGTLAANVSAACIMSALATLKAAVDTQAINTVANGIQLGFLGCLSTVSTFINEYNSLFNSDQPWRASVYAATTIGLSVVFGILIYNVPVWTRGYV